MLNKTLVELGALAEHVLEIVLAHQSKVNPLEELLTCRINCDGLLQLAELSEVLLNDLITTGHELILLSDFAELLVELGLFGIENVVL